MDGIRDDADLSAGKPRGDQEHTVEPRGALGPPRIHHHADSHDSSATGGGRTWHQEMPRWLATLDNDRTRHEYEKAVGYFFRNSGVPESLEALTFDLLLAYRGSLALRAERAPGATGWAKGHPHQMESLTPQQIQDDASATQ